MDIPLLTLIILGIVEGVTEFIPVSSTGHLILAGALLGYDPHEWAVFNVVIQLGAILAVVVLYWRTFLAVLVGLWHRRPESWRFLRNIVVAFLPSAILGLALLSYVEAMLGSTMIVSVSLIVGGVAILVIERLRAAGSGEGRRRHLAGQGGRHRLHPVPVDDPGREPLRRDHPRRLSLWASSGGPPPSSASSWPIPTMLGASTLELVKNQRRSRRGRPRRHRDRLRRVVRRGGDRHPLVHRHRLAPRLRALRLVPDRRRRRGPDLAARELSH